MTPIPFLICMLPKRHLLTGRRQTYRYVEAVKAFGRFLEHKTLERAYERAGPHFTGSEKQRQFWCDGPFNKGYFTGRLEMVFLVLTEEGAMHYMETRGARDPQGSLDVANNNANTEPLKRKSDEPPAGPSNKK